MYRNQFTNCLHFFKDTARAVASYCAQGACSGPIGQQRRLARLCLPTISLDICRRTTTTLLVFAMKCVLRKVSPSPPSSMPPLQCFSKGDSPVRKFLTGDTFHLACLFISMGLLHRKVFYYCVKKVMIKLKQILFSSIKSLHEYN